ncbi:diguanylate cyclase [Sulfurimonas aquatica]|uniref:diguanylate cyclase n=1 Tax=Sulfurimonas aquatica TaxID=2672570 RepID=A0A975B208_9BACT|nr:diguanylate cyclase [Sulfurimonas aquatica]QSZ42782.1 diguanylate cyclase [Sulfurimonas aquatica]
MNSKSYKLNLFIPVSISILIVAASVFSIVLYLQFAAIEERKMMSAPNFEQEFTNRVKNNVNAFDVLIELLKYDKEIQELFLSKKTDKLFDFMQPIYNRLNEKMDVTHLYFLDINGKVILRVHDKNRHSDIVDRYTFKQAKLLQKPFSGLEFGIKKNFTLRNVHPWFVDGKLIGYIELGKEIDKIMSAISKIIDVEVLMAVKKEIYRDASTHIMQEIHDCVETKDYYIVYNTVAVPDEMQKLCAENMEIDLHIEMNEKYYHTSVNPIKDIQGTDIGYFIFLTNATFERGLFIKMMLILSISIGVFTVLLLVMWKVLSRKRELQINEMADNLANIAVTDELTGLYNRKYFNEQGLLEINRAKREGLCFSMLMMDIDFFKRYNDTYGHQAGDEAIKTVARVIKSTFQRASELSFRIGGEEFAVLITHNKKEDLLERVSRLQEALLLEAVEHKKNDASDFLTISSGLVTCTDGDINNLDVLYKKADAALYAAKENGRNQVAVYDSISPDA